MFRQRKGGMKVLSKHIEEINMREGKEIFNQEGWHRDKLADRKLRQICRHHELRQILTSLWEGDTMNLHTKANDSVTQKVSVSFTLIIFFCFCFYPLKS